MFKLITFPELGVSDANLDVEFQFIPLGTAIEAVVMRLSSELPRIRCETISTEWRGPEIVSR